MDAFVDLRWIERAAWRLRAQDGMLSSNDAFEIARGLALQPAWQVCEPEEIVDQRSLRESAQQASEARVTVDASR